MFPITTDMQKRPNQRYQERKETGMNQKKQTHPKTKGYLEQTFSLSLSPNTCFPKWKISKKTPLCFSSPNFSKLRRERQIEPVVVIRMTRRCKKRPKLSQGRNGEKND